MKKYDVVIVTAHPDDAFLVAGGTILRCRSIGHSVYIISVTDGSNGIIENGETRKKEFASSLIECEVEGRILDYPDRQLPYYEKEIFNDVLSLLQSLDPSIVISHCDFDPHPDHRAVGHVLDNVCATVFHQLQPHRLKHFYNMLPAVLSTNILRTISHYVFNDISDYEGEKERIVSIHSSQYPHLNLRLRQHSLYSAFLGSLVDRQFVEAFFFSLNSFNAIGDVPRFLFETK